MKILWVNILIQLQSLEASKTFKGSSYQEYDLRPYFYYWDIDSNLNNKCVSTILNPHL